MVKIVVGCISFFVILVGISSFFLEDNVVSSVSSSSILQSPLPEGLLGVSLAPTRKYEYWKPEIPKVGGLADVELEARAAVAYDLESEKFLYVKNAEERLPIASLTKIMTAIIALENAEMDDHYEVEEGDVVGENSMGLLPGERHTVRDLLYGLILPSGNDAAEVIARNSAYGRSNFVYLMNKKAEDLGLFNTRFTNPSGLEGDGKQYSTALDLLMLTRYGLQNGEFRRIVSTVEYSIPADTDNQPYYLANDTNLLTSYPGVKGVKTGYTYEAGMCLVSYLEYKGHKIIAVVLNSPNRREEMKLLLDYSLRSLGVEPPDHI